MQTPKKGTAKSKSNIGGPSYVTKSATISAASTKARSKYYEPDGIAKASKASNTKKGADIGAKTISNYKKMKSVVSYKKGGKKK